MNSEAVDSFRWINAVIVGRPVFFHKVSKALNNSVNLLKEYRYCNTFSEARCVSGSFRPHVVFLDSDVGDNASIYIKRLRGIFPDSIILLILKDISTFDINTIHKYKADGYINIATSQDHICATIYYSMSGNIAVADFNDYKQEHIMLFDSQYNTVFTTTNHYGIFMLTLLSLHSAIINEVASAHIILTEYILNDIYHITCAKYKYIDSSIIWDGVTHAFMSYIYNPHKYKPEMGLPLHLYLANNAASNVRHILRSENRRMTREKLFADMTYDVFDNNNTCTYQAVYDDILHILNNDYDRNIFHLIALGERRTSEYARLMGILHLDYPIQQKIVKNTKDRILKMIRRKYADE
ncbi:MAG: hypothetical protein K9N48_02630 [Verrucomicrobia bacterium]|nr:hypothetical protein [Verrucomicrobiota bacterium]MCF7708972.1 hypothetical protein [Verrucomicrobiota bacterium]